MRNKAAPLLIGIPFFAASVNAATIGIGGLSSLNVNTFANVFSTALSFLTKIWGIQSIRVIVILGLFGWIIYKLIDTIMGKINYLAGSRTSISIAISLLSVLGMFKSLKIETIDRLAILFAVLAVGLLIFTWFIKLKNWFGDTNRNSVIRDEKRESNDRDNESKILNYLKKIGGMAKRGFGNLKDSIHEGIKSRAEAKSQIEKLKKEIDELHEVYNISSRRRGGV